MTVYVDDSKIPHRGTVWCHLMADSFSELEGFARKLNLHPSWRHGDHYDLTPSKRAKAVQLGAQQVTARELIPLRKKLRSDGKAKI